MRPTRPTIAMTEAIKNRLPYGGGFYPPMTYEELVAEFGYKHSFEDSAPVKPAALTLSQKVEALLK